MSKAKTALKGDLQKVTTHNGKKVRFMQFNKSNPRTCDFCSRSLGSGKMVVRSDEALYCSWGCSDKSVGV